MNRPTVLILASDPAFSREITAHWPNDPLPNANRPEFIVLDEGFLRDLKGSQYDLAIADASSVGKRIPHGQGDEQMPAVKTAGGKIKARRTPLNRSQNKELKQSLFAAGKPAIVIHSD
ncbi:MAG: hypothetical protein WCC46_01545, partial [Terriglobales bacterium]